MHHTLGHLPKEWMTNVLFLDGWPVHEELEPGVDGSSKPIRLADYTGSYSLEQFVGGIREPLRPASSKKPRTALENFCLQVPDIDMRDHAGKQKFEDENTTPIRKEDATLFSDLLRKIFTYDHTKRITARQVLEHP